MPAYSVTSSRSSTTKVSVAPPSEPACRAAVVVPGDGRSRARPGCEAVRRVGRGVTLTDAGEPAGGSGTPGPARPRGRACRGAEVREWSAKGAGGPGHDALPRNRAAHHADVGVRRAVPRHDSATSKACSRPRRSSGRCAPASPRSASSVHRATRTSQTWRHVTRGPAVGAHLSARRRAARRGKCAEPTWTGPTPHRLAARQPDAPAGRRSCSRPARRVHIAAEVAHRTSILPLVMAGLGHAVMPSSWNTIAVAVGARVRRIEPTSYAPRPRRLVGPLGHPDARRSGVPARDRGRGRRAPPARINADQIASGLSRGDRR